VTTHDLIFGWLLPILSSMLIAAQAIKIRQLRGQVKVANLNPRNMGYLLSKDSNYDTAVLVINNSETSVLYGQGHRSSSRISQQIYGCSSIVTTPEKLLSNKEFLEQEKLNLIEDRKKLLLMEESLAKKEQAIIEMEVQQELNS